MTNSIYLSTIEPRTGKSLIALGIIELILRKTTKVGFFRPIIQDPIDNKPDTHIDLILSYFKLPQTYDDAFGLYYSEVNHLMGEEKLDKILDKIITKYKKLEKKCDFIVCENSDYVGENSTFAFDLNVAIAKTLGCSLLILGNGHQKSVEEISLSAKIVADSYREKHCNILGIIVNKVAHSDLKNLAKSLRDIYGKNNYLFSVIPYDKRLDSPRMREVAEQLKAKVLYGEKRLNNLVFDYLIAAMQMQHAITQLHDNDLVVTPSDRGDVIIGALQAHQSTNYPNLAGILLTTECHLESSIAQLIAGLSNPLPIVWVDTYTYPTASSLQTIYSSLKPGDIEKINWSIELFDKSVNLSILENLINKIKVEGITPKMFTYNSIQKAKANKRHIVLPEGKDHRILKAVATLTSQDIVDVTLLGERNRIEGTIQSHGIQLDINRLNIINPMKSPKLDDYTQTLYEVRKHKGITLENAKDMLMDVSYFGTMMVYVGDADGMVSGAIHTTGNTIRPSLQIIKTKPEYKLVSSVFFMCLDDKILVYGDCAINANPTAEQLAEIAIISAETAQTFGIFPRVALLSYSSGNSGIGEDVERVKQATILAKKRRPDLLFEGPIQYDAAVDRTVAAQKMPDSKVAGEATVFVFPDLNTGNNTYKAVQRETGAIAIGPILQGLKKPVNDLSRGCTVEDIINTVVITAIQASYN
ncbi:MAG: phosphate acetyltransferase [Crocosphaera sp.]